MASALSTLFLWLTKIAVFFEFLYNFVFKGLQFLWNAAKFCFAFAAILPGWLSGSVILAISVCIFLLILGR